MAAEGARAEKRHRLVLDGKAIEWRLVHSSTAKKLRMKVGPDGVVVVLPAGRREREAAAFIGQQRGWVAEQLNRVRDLTSLRRPSARGSHQLLYRGEPMTVRLARDPAWQGQNRITVDGGTISIVAGPRSLTSPAKTLNNWLRRQARDRINVLVAEIGRRLHRQPNRVYVMSQRTKWGNCSSRGNLSFNWRLVMAPDFVLRYLVTHEMVHLAVPDHSRKFWLTVQSLCPESDRARQWLVANGPQLLLLQRPGGLDV
jgi:predicted metal-dependent hydrolase